MPLVDVQVIEGVFDEAQKQDMIQRVTEAMVAVEGPAMRDVTWVRILEVKSGQWAIGGNPLTSQAVRQMAAAEAS
ncbi:4-oxalocrotonate tautomerase family protein [Fodinicurvata halophila]|uniref:4-oxalocrotonate tautomerase family protein n=1 Tax=Fodinicurvata halophila TaxID=1419723 RepID=A0ABV8UNS7_9PROT